MKLVELKEIKPFPKTSGPQGGAIFRGVTLQAGDPKHTHRFEIKFGRNGKLISGRTLSDDSGHSHQISSVGRTESAQGHSHPLPIQSGGRTFHGGGGRTPPGGPGSMTGGGTGGGGMTGTGAGTGTPGTGDPGGGGGGNGGGM